MGVAVGCRETIECIGWMGGLGRGIRECVISGWDGGGWGEIMANSQHAYVLNMMT